MQRMTEAHTAPLQALTDQVAPGLFVDTPWLRKHGYTTQLVSKYVKSGWLQRAAAQLYQRPQTNRATAPKWVNLIYSMQSIMGYDIHVGGLSSLRLQGLSHYVALGDREDICVYGRDVPSFLSKVDLEASVHERKSTLFMNPYIGLKEILAPNTGLSLNVSTPERAILEYINEMKPEDSWHHFEVLFEGLVNLRPSLISQVLESCSKIKVKRLFCVMASYFDYPWFRRMDFSNTEFGTAPRAFVKGGKLHPDYHITVPLEYLPRVSEEPLS